VQQRDDLGVRARSHPHEAPAVAEGGASEPLDVSHLSRQVGRFDERGLRDIGVANAALRVAESEEQLQSVRIVRRARERAQRHVVEACTLLVRELLHRPFCREPRVCHRSVHGPDGETRVAMASELREARSQVAPAQHLERAPGLVVESAPPQ
jgi:AmiR/NasT family two-component response regulator